MSRPFKFVFAGTAVLVMAVVFSVGLQCWQVGRTVVEVESLNGAIDDRGDPLFGPTSVTFALMGCEQIIDDAAFQRLLPNLACFQRLEQLDLSGTALTPDGLKGIDRLKTLRRLELPARSISENSLPAICGLKRLETLYAYDAKTDLAAVDRLQQMMPNTVVHIRENRGGPNPLTNYAAIGQRNNKD